MSPLETFSEIIKHDEPLAPYTWLKLGGPAQCLLEPRDAEELAEIVTICHQEGMPVRTLGGGSNVLIRDEGIGGAVLKLQTSGFSQIEINGTHVRAGAATPLVSLVSQTVQQGLAGLENVVGIPGTLGGAICCNSGTRNASIGQFVKSVTVMNSKGEVSIRQEDELSFTYRDSSIDDLAILEADLELQQDDPAAIIQRMRKLWIMKKASQPFSHQSAGCVFKNPRGMSAGALMERSGMKGTRIGGAEISERHANFIISHPEASSEDVLRLIELSRSRVAKEFGVDLELELKIW